MTADHRHRLLGILVAGVVCILAAAWIRPRLIAQQQLRAIVESFDVDPETLDQALADRSDTREALLSVWQTGRIPQRRAALTYLLGPRGGRRLGDDLRPAWLTEAASDPDVTLRELALGNLMPGLHPRPQDLVAPQLADTDPHLRRLGLDALRRVGHLGWTPLVLPLVRDTDPSVAVAADALLRRWSGRDSGLRLSQALPADDSIVPRELDDATLERLAQARDAWPAWWASTPHPDALVELTAQLEPPRPRVDDFALPDLRGEMRRLNEFRGRTVLLNFWATWCPPCAAELPTLAELQRNHPNDLVILGICLDSLNVGPHGSPAKTPIPVADELRELRRNVQIVVSRYGLPYPILFDPANNVGRRFDGQELPTQALIDPAGRLVRRFVGARTLATWESLLGHARAVAPR